MSKFEDGSSYSKRQRVITNQIPDQKSSMRMNYVRQRIKHEAHQKGSLSYHTNTWYGNIFNGYCSTCHKYGHNALECKNNEKKKGSVNKIKCRRCNFFWEHNKIFPYYKVFLM